MIDDYTLDFLIALVGWLCGYIAGLIVTRSRE
jgi:hypothetical protein